MSLLTVQEIPAHSSLGLEDLEISTLKDNGTISAGPPGTDSLSRGVTPSGIEGPPS